MRLGEITCHEIKSQYQLKNASYFHRNGLMIKRYHTHKQYIAQNPHFYNVSTTGIKKTRLELTPQIMGGRS